MPSKLDPRAVLQPAPVPADPLGFARSLGTTAKTAEVRATHRRPKAFMNDVVVPWCREQKIEVTRSRAYKKNDQVRGAEERCGGASAGRLRPL